MTTSHATIWRERLARAVPLLPWLVRGGARRLRARRRRLSRHASLSFALIYAIFVTGLNLFMGYAGQVTLRPQRLRGDRRLHLGGADRELRLGPLLGGFAAGLALRARGRAARGLSRRLRLQAAIISPWRRSRIGLIVYEVAVQWQSVTQGYMGISGIPPLGIGRLEIDLGPRAARVPRADRAA